MPKQLFTNNAETVLNGTLSAASTTVTLSAGSGPAFPSITGGNYFVGTIYELNGSGLEINHEIVKVTARVADSLTVVRAFDNTTARDYPDNNTNNPSQVVYFSLRWTAFAAGNSLTADDNLASVASVATARTNLGLGTIATQDASNVNVSGGVISGITDLAIADGGTGASTAAGARTNLGAAVNGANNDITSMSAITGGVGTPDYIDFDTTATTTGAVGRARWDDTNGTMQIGLKGGVVSLQVGQEIVAYVRNAEATDLAEGEVVYIFGAQGDKATVKRASNAAEATSSKSFGMVTEPIAAGQLGFVTVQGVVNNLNTNAFTAGDFVWLGATAGTITNTRPNPPAHAVLIGVVEKSSVGGGTIYVNISNGVELDELHDIYITSKADDDSLFYNAATGLWTNRTPANARTALGVTATGADTTYLYRANNLSDLNNADTALSNLGGTTLGKLIFKAATILAAQQSLDLEVGVDIQAYNANLTSLSNKGIFYKSDSTIVAFSKTGNFTMQTAQAIKVEVNGSIKEIAASTSITMPTATAGTDYAIWAKTDGTLEATSNHTSPPTANARKVGGFHYAAGGNATGTSGGNTTAQINEYSIWDLKFRPVATDPRGMALVAGGFWMDIYLTGVDAITNGSSKYNVTIGDGSSPPKVPTMFGGNGSTTYGSYTWFEACELASAFNKRLPTQREFMAAGYGTTEATASGGSDVPTTGVTGTGATSAWNVFTSKWGIIQSTGCMWIWADDRAGPYAAASWNANTEGRGSEYNAPNAGVLGGSWLVGALCGSRCSDWSAAASISSPSFGSRFACDHLQLD